MQIKILKHIRSCNFASNACLNPRYIVIHCVGYREQQILEGFSKRIDQGGWGASPHYFIPQYSSSGKTLQEYPIYELVPIPKVAQHAGESRWHNDEDLNQYSIGIELHMPNYANVLSNQEQLNWFHFEAFTTLQIQALEALLLFLIQRYFIKPQNILGHSDIAAWRVDPVTMTIIPGKTDPGSTFPWEDLAKRGIGVWPKSQRLRSQPINMQLAYIQALLLEIGYHVPCDGILDIKTHYTLKAIQMRFLPNEESQGKEFWAKLVTVLENLSDQQYAYEPLYFSAS